MIFLIKGELQVMDVNENGQNVWLASVYPGASTGELGLITEENRSASLIAIQDSIIAILPKKDALDLITTHASVARRVMQHLAKIIKDNNTQLALTALPTAQERIEAILYQRITRHPNNTQTIENLPPQESIATMANTSRETVSRTINKLIKNGVLEKDKNRKCYLIRKPNELRGLTL
jgi:CRP-like cAMP-binding protein